MPRAIPLLAVACVLAAQAALAEDDIEAGRRIYMEGVLPSGAPLLAQREGGVTLAGAQAACANCHRRSGMGSYEGGSVVPAVAGPILFSKLKSRRGMPTTNAITRMDVRFRDRPAYDAQSFARAMREGVSAAAYVFDYLMPRYPLGAPDLRALEAYLRSLTLQAAPGVEDDAIHLATVITPGAETAKKQAMLEVLNAFVAGRILPRTASSGARRWRLHVWELSGAEPEWSAQLAERYRDRPVMALLSGLGSGSWAPVHEFCERRSVPCLFPNTDLPGAPEPGYASFYFNGGVGLEAQIVARHLLGSGNRVSRVLQLYREGEIGAAAARVLGESLAKEGMASERRALPQDGRWAEALAGLGPRDALVLWLRASDIERLTRAVASPPAAARAIVASGTMGGLEAMPLPAAWRKRTLLTYPVDTPDRRAVRMNSSLTPWLTQNRLPADHEILRGNTLAACRLLEAAMARLRGRYVRDYLIESVETPMGNPAATSAYPRFSLGAGQRYASKGAYLVRFAGADGRELALATDWIVP